MFGIFYMLFNGTMSRVAKAKQNIENENNRERARLNGDFTYFGENGERLVSNNKSVYRKSVDGDDVLADLYTGEVYKNFSEEKRKKKEIEELNKGNTVIMVQYDEMKEFNKKYKSQMKSVMIRPEYKDIKTGRFYIYVCINGLQFYMDIITGQIIRLADKQDVSKKLGNLSIDEIINITNERQKLIESDLLNHNMMWLEKNYYLKSFHDLYMVDDSKEFIIGACTDNNIVAIRNKLKGDSYE